MADGYGYGIGSDEIYNYMRTVIMIDEAKRSREAEAIRWQGAVEYDTLVKSGVQPGEALRRSAGKLFFNDPRGLAASTSELLQTPGQIITTPTGRELIQQPTGRLQPLPTVSYGYTTVRGADNQMYRIPLTQEEYLAAPRQNVPQRPPQIMEYPGYGAVMVQPSGVGTQLRPSPFETVKWKNPDTQAVETITKGELALREARMKASTLLDEAARIRGEIDANQTRYGPDWLGWPAEAYTNQLARIESRLKAYDLTKEGEPIPGSRLAREVGLEPMPETTAAPGGAQGQRLEIPDEYWTGGGTLPPAPVLGRFTPPKVTLKPNEVLLRKKLMDGSYRYDVFDKTTGAHLYHAQ